MPVINPVAAEQATLRYKEIFRDAGNLADEVVSTIGESVLANSDAEFDRKLDTIIQNQKVIIRNQNKIILQNNLGKNLDRNA